MKACSYNGVINITSNNNKPITMNNLVKQTFDLGLLKQWDLVQGRVR